MVETKKYFVVKISFFEKKKYLKIYVIFYTFDVYSKLLDEKHKNS